MSGLEGWGGGGVGDRGGGRGLELGRFERGLGFGAYEPVEGLLLKAATRGGREMGLLEMGVGNGGGGDVGCVDWGGGLELGGGVKTGRGVGWCCEVFLGGGC